MTVFPLFLDPLHVFSSLMLLSSTSIRVVISCLLPHSDDKKMMIFGQFRERAPQVNVVLNMHGRCQLQFRKDCRMVSHTQDCI